MTCQASMKTVNGLLPLQGRWSWDPSARCLLTRFRQASTQTPPTRQVLLGSAPRLAAACILWARVRNPRRHAVCPAAADHAGLQERVPPVQGLVNLSEATGGGQGGEASRGGWGGRQGAMWSGQGTRGVLAADHAARWVFCRRRWWWACCSPSPRRLTCLTQSSCWPAARHVGGERWGPGRSWGQTGGSLGR